MAVQDIKFIDIMNYYMYDERGKKLFYSGPESGLLLKTAAAVMLPPPMSTKEYVGTMDKAGYEKCFMCAFKMGSYRNRSYNIDYTNEVVYEEVKKFPDRLIGISGYDPFDIANSIRSLEKSVKEYGFKGVYAHTLGWGIPANDRRMYPVYAKCVELDIPFSMQIGQSWEPLPSEPGRPIYVDSVALDFPELRFVCSHTGYPWVEECVAVAWSRENIFIDTSAHAPNTIPQRMAPLMSFMASGAGRNKVLHGTNGWPLERIRPMFEALQMKEENFQAICRDNAIRIYKL
jgi:predicted TIM-barrel fold metal-dependent hydrolase